MLATHSSLRADGSGEPVIDAHGSPRRRTNLERVSSTERVWTRRLRWRLRGAWTWPAFAVLTLADGLILHLLPPVSADIDVVLGVILASFGNLILVGAVSPWVARRLHRRQAGGAGEPLAARPPREVVLDRTATALLGAGAVGLLAAGLATRPLIVSPTEESEEAARVVRDYVAGHGSAEVRRNGEAANTIRLGQGYFRTCVPLEDRRRAFCVFVDVNPEPPTVREDPNPAPNQQFLDRRGGP